MNEIFICYRRSDSAQAAGRLATALERSFGRQRVYLDVTDQEPGQNWREGIASVLHTCKAFVLVIGSRWLLPWASHGALEQPKVSDDVVRFEIRTALQRRIPIFPM